MYCHYPKTKTQGLNYWQQRWKGLRYYKPSTHGNFLYNSFSNKLWWCLIACFKCDLNRCKQIKKTVSTTEDKLEMWSFPIKCENTPFGHREVSLLTNCPFGRFYSSAKDKSFNTNISDKYLPMLQTILNYKIKKNNIS